MKGNTLPLQVVVCHQTQYKLDAKLYLVKWLAKPALSYLLGLSSRKEDYTFFIFP